MRHMNAITLLVKAVLIYLCALHSDDVQSTGNMYQRAFLQVQVRDEALRSMQSHSSTCRFFARSVPPP